MSKRKKPPLEAVIAVDAILLLLLQGYVKCTAQWNYAERRTHVLHQRELHSNRSLLLAYFCRILSGTRCSSIASSTLLVTKVSESMNTHCKNACIHS